MSALLPTDLSAGELAIETRGLVKKYGALRALHQLDLHVPVHAVYVLVGPNGAGKSTTMQVLLDLLRPTHGEAHVLGMNVAQQSARVRANIGYVPEQNEWGHGWMTVGRLLHHHAQYFPTWDVAYARQLAKAFSLPAAQKMLTLSKGQRRRVHLVMALAHRPPVLMLDEPTDGLDPVMRDETMQVLIAHVADTPTTTLISTHHVNEVEQFADHIGVMRNGALRLQASTESLRTQLLRYRADLTEDWRGAPDINGSAIRRTTSQNAIDWVVWGNEQQTIAKLSQAGANVRSVHPLTLEETAVALLSPGDAVR